MANPCFSRQGRNRQKASSKEVTQGIHRQGERNKNEGAGYLLLQSQNWWARAQMGGSGRSGHICT